MSYKYLDLPDVESRYRVHPDSRAVDFYLENIKCGGCLAKIEKFGAEADHVHNMEVNLGTKVVRVELDEEGRFSEIAEQFARLGFTPHPLSSADGAIEERKKENRQKRNRVAVAGVLAGNIMLFSFAVYSGATSEWKALLEISSAVLFLGVVFYAAKPFYESALSSLRSSRASIDLPIAVSILVGAIISYYHLWTGGPVYFDSLAVLVFLILSSRFVLSGIQQNLLSPNFLKDFFSTSAVQRLDPNHELQTQSISPESIRIGDRLLIESGETIPVDSKLIEGEAFFDTSIVTGESVPRRFLEGTFIPAGSKLADHRIEVQAESTLRSSSLGRLIDEVEKQVLKRTPLTAFAERVAQVFVLSILGLGFVFAVAYSMFDTTEAIERSLALVILACPCALAFATPLAQSIALNSLAKRGLLVKDASILERLAKVQDIVFDKTGTLTEGVLAFGGWNGAKPDDKTISIVLALEEPSRHPIAKTLRKEFEGKSLPRVEMTDWKETPGRGVSGLFEGKRYSLQRDKDELSSISLLRESEKIVSFKVTDTPKLDAAHTIARLEKMNRKVYLVSGDQEHNVREFAARVGLDSKNAFFQMSPEEKRKFIENHPNSMMVGDGNNDLLALVHSGVSVAVKGSAEASLRVAQVYSTQGRIGAVVEILEEAQHAMKVIHRNLFISLAYNAIGAGLALGGLVTPVVAAVLMPLSTFFLVGTTWFSLGREKNSSKQVGYLKEGEVPA